MRPSTTSSRPSVPVLRVISMLEVRPSATSNAGATIPQAQPGVMSLAPGRRLPLPSDGPRYDARERFIMWHVVRRLLLGFALIALASAGLLFSDTSRHRAR